MKNKKIILLLNLLSIGLMLMIFSCDFKKDAIDIAHDHNVAKFNSNEDEKNARFIADVTEILLEEIELAKMAQKNSIRTDVHQLAGVIEIEYNQCYLLLKEIAHKKNITIPSEIKKDKKKLYNSINYEIADDFDKKYFNISEQQHKIGIESFEKIQKECKDSSIKNWAENTTFSFKQNLAAITNLRSAKLIAIYK